MNVDLKHDFSERCISENHNTLNYCIKPLMPGGNESSYVLKHTYC